MSVRLRRALSGKQPIWHSIAEVPVYHSNCATINGVLLTVGGCDSFGMPTDAIHTYDPTTDSWSVVSHMSTPRYLCLTAVLPGDKVLAAGGFTTASRDLQSETSTYR